MNATEAKRIGIIDTDLLGPIDNPGDNPDYNVHMIIVYLKDGSAWLTESEGFSSGSGKEFIDNLSDDAIWDEVNDADIQFLVRKYRW